MRMLDNVIDINYYAVKKARDSNLQHRPVGLGIMGFQDALHELRVPYASRRGHRLRRPLDGGGLLLRLLGLDRTRRGARALLLLRGLASGTRGSCRRTRSSSCSRSAAATWKSTCRESMDWSALRARIAQARHAQLQLRGDRADGDDLQHHRRLGLHRAQLPEPVREVEPLGRIHGGERAPGARPEEAGPVGLRDGRRPEALRRLRRQDRPRPGGAAQASTPPPSRSSRNWIVEAAARRQKWIDQAQSLNIYMAGASGKKLDDTYKLAWLRGLKTTYYLRTLAATSAEKSTGKGGELNAVPAHGGLGEGAGDGAAEADGKFCSIDNPDCEACQ